MLDGNKLLLNLTKDGNIEKSKAKLSFTVKIN